MKRWKSKPIKILALILIACSFLGVASGQQTGNWGDQGDGTYRNPILPGDYSNPDLIHVGKNYYLLATMHTFSPGGVILQSNDLVNWKTLGYVVNNISLLDSNLNWNKMNSYGYGVYAGSLNYHKGKYWVYFTVFQDAGFFVATADQPAGPWTVKQMTDAHNRPLRTYRWDDPCPFWDDDGKAYLVASKVNGAWYPHLFQMNGDGTQLLDADVDSMNKKGPQPNGEGTVIYNVPTSEASKIYKINNYYYFFHNEVINHLRVGMMKRSRNLFGTKADGSAGKAGEPGTYELKQVLHGLGETGDREPNQGGLVQIPDGRWYFITHQGRGGYPDGRPLSLLPVTWKDDWPIIGADPDLDGIGEMVWSAKKPIDGYPIEFPQGSDDFNNTKLSLQWEWNYQPRDEQWSLTKRPGFLRLYAFKPIQPGVFFKAGNTITQRYFKSDRVEVTIKMDINHMNNGQKAGLTHLNGGVNYSNVGVEQINASKKIMYEEDGTTISGPEIAPSITTIWFRSMVDSASNNQYAYSIDGNKFIPFGRKYPLKWGKSRGDNLGIYCYTNRQEDGYIDVDWFHYTFQNKK